MSVVITEELVRKLVATVDAGLVSGLGVPEPGKMCVEAAISYALGEPHSGGPSCVDPAVRAPNILLSDALWSSAGEYGGSIMTNLRERPLRLERALSVDYVNREQKMREIEQWGLESKWQGWKLVVVWTLCFAFSIGAWVYVIWLGL